VTAEELARRLEGGEIVRLPAAAWRGISGSFEEVERHGTAIAGDIVIVKLGTALAAVEAPGANERVLRRLADAEAVLRFVETRREQYDRMWDGCGSRIDYDA
jgi:hypothetical protein